MYIAKLMHIKYLYTHIALVIYTESKSYETEGEAYIRTPDDIVNEMYAVEEILNVVRTNDPDNLYKVLIKWSGEEEALLHHMNDFKIS